MGSRWEGEGSFRSPGGALQRKGHGAGGSGTQTCRESRDEQLFFQPNICKHSSGKDEGLFDGLKVHPSGNVFATGPGGVLIIKENGDHIGTIRTEVRTANCAFDDKFEYLYMTSDMYLTRIKVN